MASPAGYLRYLAEKKVFDVGQIVRKYEEWILEHKYMVMAHEREKWGLKRESGNISVISRFSARLKRSRMVILTFMQSSFC